MPAANCGRAPGRASSTDRRRSGSGPLQVLITRPRAEAEALAREIGARGHAVLIAPLLAIEPLPEVDLPLEGVQAILLTSANAVPALSATMLRLPVFAVGATTAGAARAAGARQVHVAQGDATSLAGLVGAACRPNEGALLHLSGTDVRPGLAARLIAAGFDVRRHAVYRARAAHELPPTVRDALHDGTIDAVLLFSPRSAEIFLELVRKRDLAGRLQRTAAICLSAAVGEVCQAVRWGSVHVAARPDRAAVLDQLDAIGRRC